MCDLNKYEVIHVWIISLTDVAYRVTDHKEVCYGKLGQKGTVFLSTSLQLFCTSLVLFLYSECDAIYILIFTGGYMVVYI